MKLGNMRSGEFGKYRTEGLKDGRVGCFRNRGDNGVAVSPSSQLERLRHSFLIFESEPGCDGADDG